MTRSESEVLLAREYGLECIPDSSRGEYWFKFTIGKSIVWQAINGRLIWVVADLIDNRYQNHKRFEHDELENAFQEAVERNAVE